MTMTTDATMDDDEKLIAELSEASRLHPFTLQRRAAPLLALAAGRIRDLRADVERLRGAFFKSQAEVCDTLGRALGYPFYKDDPENFPGATAEADGVCTGEHVAETIAAEAAARLSALKTERDRMAAALRTLAEWPITDPMRNMDAANMQAIARDALSQEPPPHRS